MTTVDLRPATPAVVTPDVPSAASPRRVLSGIKPTGEPTLGNYLGALRQFVALQDDITADPLYDPADPEASRAVYFVADLHALTVTHDPQAVRRRSLELARLYLALGLDASVVFLQSSVPAHSELSYLLECVARTGELSRMIQYKEKGRGEATTRASLFTYPALMAADILLYGTTEVPVGDDQRQHVELTRDLAERVNREYGGDVPVFVVPRAVQPPVAARVMDLLDPTAKMGKTAGASGGVILLTDPPEVIRRKVARAVTDSDGDVRYDPAAKPGVSNLLTILAACRDLPDPAAAADGIDGYAALKREVADAVIDTLAPLQQRLAATDDDSVLAALRRGRESAHQLAVPVLARAQQALGLLSLSR
ncbi:MAG: tryptophan--tRNA ligase [Actinomycetes bacterium]